MPDNPLISVIIPVFNDTPYIKKCFDSIIFQTFSDIEILCFYNDISEKTSDILFNTIDKRIKLYKQENSDISQAKNCGINYANGRYISFINPNDWLLLDLYEVASKFILCNNTDIYMFNSCLYSENMIDIPMFESFEEEDILNNKSENEFYTYKDISKILTKNLYVENKIYNKDFLVDNHLYFENKLCANTLFNIQTLFKANTIKINTNPYYRFRQNALREKIDLNNVFDIFYINKKICEFLTKEDVILKYKAEFFNYSFNSYFYYFNLCPSEIKKYYFEIMQKELRSIYNTLPQQVQNFINTINEVNAILTLEFEQISL